MIKMNGLWIIAIILVAVFILPKLGIGSSQTIITPTAIGNSLSCEQWQTNNNVVTLQNVGGINGPIKVYKITKIISKMVRIGNGCSINFIPRTPNMICSWTSDSTYCEQKFKCVSDPYPALNYLGKYYYKVCDTGLTYSKITNKCENPLAWTAKIC